ncbi:hypothetical protein CRENBAI_025974 [Crenichthys baileyi]|uniref:Uncharacterized protein n=1 Tax=Crenichthys baileyi TaxID=28760 RepID=A0AAV9QQN7_9TELE
MNVLGIISTDVFSPWLRKTFCYRFTPTKVQKFENIGPGGLEFVPCALGLLSCNLWLHLFSGTPESMNVSLTGPLQSRMTEYSLLPFAPFHYCFFHNGTYFCDPCS